MQQRTATEYFNDGCKFAKEGIYDKALEAYTMSLNLDENEKTYANRALVYVEIRKYNQALSDFTKAIKINPNEVKIYNNRGLAHYKFTRDLRGVSGLCDYAKAILDFMKALEIKPKYPKALHSLKIIFEKAREGELDHIDKEKIFAAIKLLPKETRIPLLKQCLDAKTPLGARFWKKEDWRGCSLERGVLRDICAYLQKKDPSFVIPISSSRNVMVPISSSHVEIFVSPPGVVAKKMKKHKKNDRQIFKL